MPNNRLVDVILRLTFDRNAANQTKRALSDVEKGVDRIDSEARQARQSADAFFDTLEQGATSAQKAVKKISLGGVSGGAGKLAQVAGGIAGGGAAEPLRLLGDFSGALGSLGPVAVASAAGLAAVTVALAEYNKGLEAQKAALTGALAGVDAYYKLIASGATTEQVQKQIDDLEKQQGILAQQRSEIQTQIDAAWSQAVAQFGDAGARALQAAGQLPTTQLEEELKRLGDQYSQNDILVNRLAGALEKGTFATNDAAAAEDKLAQARTQGVLANADRLVRTELTLVNAYNMSSEQLDKRLEAINNEVTANDHAIAALEASGDTSAEVTKAIENYRAKNGELKTEYLNLLTLVDDVVKAREKEAKQLEFEKKQRQEIASAQQDYEDEILQLETDANEKRADLAKTLNDKLVDLAQDAADSAADALRSLEQDRADLLSQLQNEEADAAQQAQLDNLQALIDFQREEERAARDHARNLKAIRDRAADSELKQIADRDFQGLFFSRRQTARELSDASQQFADEREERQIAAQQASQDRARQFENERRQRQQNYQRQLNDLQSNYNRELQMINDNLRRQQMLTHQAYTNDLTMLNQKLTAELNLRSQAQQKELQFLAQTEAQRLQIITQTQNALLQRAYAAMGQITGGGGTGSSQSSGGSSKGNLLSGAFALGGVPPIGKPALVNELGTERFRAGGNTVMLPGGLGAFIPFRAGQVQPAAGRSLVLNQTNNISGNNLNEGRIVTLITQRTNDLMKEYFGL